MNLSKKKKYTCKKDFLRNREIFIKFCVYDTKNFKIREIGVLSNLFYGTI